MAQDATFLADCLTLSLNTLYCLVIDESFMASQRFRAPVRVSATIPWITYERLIAESQGDGRSISNLAAFLIESALQSRLPCVPVPVVAAPALPQRVTIRLRPAKGVMSARVARAV